MAILFAAFQSVAHAVTMGMLRALARSAWPKPRSHLPAIATRGGVGHGPRGHVAAVAVTAPLFGELKQDGPDSRAAEDTPYRFTMVERAWHVARPHASLVHAFDDLDEAVGFVLP